MTQATTGTVSSTVVFAFCENLALNCPSNLYAVLSQMLIQQSTPETFVDLLQDIQERGADQGQVRQLTNVSDTRAFLFRHIEAIEHMHKTHLDNYYPLDHLRRDLASTIAWWALEVFVCEILTEFDLSL